MGRSPACLVVGEVAQAHDGSLGMAHGFIDAIARAGGDAVKFQTLIASAESTAAEPWRVPFSTQDASRYEYWKRMEFTEAQWQELQRHAVDRGLLFLSSPFSVEAFELLKRVGVAAWKVASGEMSDVGLLDRMLDTSLPIFLSSGMSPMSEIDAAVSRIQRRGHDLAVLQCTSAYPCPPERVGLHLLPAFATRYDCTSGLSDHSGTIYPGLAAATMGAGLLEVHVTLSRDMFGPDVVASVTIAELQQLAEGVRFIERMLSQSPGKDELVLESAHLREAFTKSVVARRDLDAGTLLEREHLAAKKPGTGIAAARLPEMLGLRLRRSLRADELLSEADVEQAGGFNP
jgi:N-acetylneuraminate synthase